MTSSGIRIWVSIPPDFELELGLRRGVTVLKFINQNLIGSGLDRIFDTSKSAHLILGTFLLQSHVRIDLSDRVVRILITFRLLHRKLKLGN